MQPFIQVFGLTISAAPAAIWLGFLLATWLAGKTARPHGLDGDAVNGALVTAGIAGLLGARLGYVLLHAGAYARDPLGALALNASALDGLSFGLVFVLVAAWQLRRAGQLRLALADALAAPGLVMAMGLALASYFDGAVFGAPAALQWAVEVWGALRHPVQIYEIAGFALALVFLLATSRSDWPRGARALVATLMGGAALAAAEGLRADEAVLIAGMRATQLLWTAAAVGAAWALGEQMAGARTSAIKALRGSGIGQGLNDALLAARKEDRERENEPRRRDAQGQPDD